MSFIIEYLRKFIMVEYTLRVINLVANKLITFKANNA